MEFKRFIPLVLTVFCLLLSSSFAHATQKELETENYTTSKTKKFNFPPIDEIDRVLLEEMNYVYESCINDHDDSSFRDCKCYAMAYLEERIKTPNVEKQLVYNAIQTECMAPEKMKGHYFGVCMAGSVSKRGAASGKDPIEFCNCYANYVTDNVLKLKKMYNSAVRNIQKYANTSCR